jgi:hypothetical protein
MTPEMQRALVELSAFYHRDPSVVFRRVLEVIAMVYDGTMAMINLIDGDRIGYRDIINPHPLFRRYRSILLSDSY